MIIEFCIAAVNIFSAIYEAKFKSVYSGTDKPKLTLQDAQRCVKAFYETISGTIPLNTTNLFKEGDISAQDLCREMERMMNVGFSLDN